MFNFVMNCMLWTFAIYGLFDIVKSTINNFKSKRIESNGVYIIVAAKNQELQIEGFLRSTIFKLLYGKDVCVENVIVTDLNSEDKTKDILESISRDYSEIRMLEWDNCKKMLDNLE